MINQLWNILYFFNSFFVDQNQNLFKYNDKYDIKKRLGFFNIKVIFYDYKILLQKIIITVYIFFI